MNFACQSLKVTVEGGFRAQKWANIKTTEDFIQRTVYWHTIEQQVSLHRLEMYSCTASLVSHHPLLSIPPC